MYRGKFDAKNREDYVAARKQAAPEAPQAPRPDPWEQPEQRPVQPAKQQPKKKKSGSRAGTVVFYTLYLLFIAAFAAGLVYTLNWLHGWLRDYEAAQPTEKCKQVFEELFEDPNWAHLYTLAGIEDTAFEGQQAFDVYMTQMVGDQELTYSETSGGLSGDKKYFVKLGDQRIGSFTLTGKTEKVTDIPVWELGQVELFFDRNLSVAVQKLQGHTVKINGVELDDSYTVQKSTSIAHNYLPEGITVPETNVQYVGGLMAAPEITVTDQAGAVYPVVYNEETKVYVEQATPGSAEIPDDIQKLVLDSGKIYARFMINKANGNQLASYFDTGSETYKSLTDTKKELWMVHASDNYNFTEESVTDYIPYGDKYFSAHLEMKLNVPRNDGTTKVFPVDTTMFFEKTGRGRFCIAMTNKDMTEQVSEIRLTFKNGDTVLSSGFYASDSRELNTPLISAPEGQVFSGWVREDVDANGKKTLSLMFTPDETGLVTIPGGQELKPMTLYALFEDAASVTAPATGEAATAAPSEAQTAETEAN